MKTLRAALIIFALAAVYFTCRVAKRIMNEVDPVCDQSVTLTKIYNHSNDSVLVYVTLGTTPGCLQNVLDIPFVTDTVPGQRGLQGTFILHAGDSTAAFAPDSGGFNGVISFGYGPDNCPDALHYPNGINQYEFILNNNYQGVNAQETIDISCVHGVNCVIRVDCSGILWNAGPGYSGIQSFANTMDRSRIGTVGVYPYGCDTCTGSKTPPACIKLPQPAQKQSICNVQRNANNSGGMVKVIYLGQININ